MGSALLWAVILLAPSLHASAAGAAEAFEVSSLGASGRTVAAELADLDGDGRSDLLEISFQGIPPDDRRSLRVHFQNADGRIPAGAQLELSVPAGVAAFDVADVLPPGGHELLLLQRRSLRIISFAGREPLARELRLPGGVSAGLAGDERGLSRLALASRKFAPEPWLVIPGLGEALLLGMQGELRARLAIGERINYFVQPPGLIYTESDIQFFYDAPRLSLGDIDGDGRTDVLSSGRHELRVFLQRADGGFASEASRRMALERVSEEDHIRSSGTVRASAADIDADGRLDLMISSTSGGLSRVHSTTEIFFNRAGSWQLDAPDFRVEQERAMVADRLVDADGDGELELIQGRIPLSVLELAELFLTRSADAHLALYELERRDLERRKGSAKPAPRASPRFTRKLSLPFSFETGRPRGFTPTFAHDLDGDGQLDLLHSGDGDELELFPGPDFARRKAHQALDSEGVLRPGHLDADGAIDFVLYNPRRPGAPIQLLRNRLQKDRSSSIRSRRPEPSDASDSP